MEHSPGKQGTKRAVIRTSATFTSQASLFYSEFYVFIYFAQISLFWRFSFIITSDPCLILMRTHLSSEKARMRTLMRFCVSQLHNQQHKIIFVSRLVVLKTEEKKIDVLVTNVWIALCSGGRQTVRQLKHSSVAVLSCQCSDSLYYLVEKCYPSANR